MLKLPLLFTLLFISTQLLVAQKKSPLNFNVPKVDFVSAVTKTLGNTNTIESTNLLSTKKEDSLIALKTNNANAIIKKKTSAIGAQQMDSIWLKTGQTLAGKIIFDKDSNTFLFFRSLFYRVFLHFFNAWPAARICVAHNLPAVAIHKKSNDEPYKKTKRNNNGHN